MVVPPSIPVVLGSLTVFATSASLAVQAILACGLRSRASAVTRTVPIAASALQGALLLFVAVGLASYLQRRAAVTALSRHIKHTTLHEKTSPKQSHRKATHHPVCLGVWLGLGLVISTAAAAVGAAALVRLEQAADTLPATVFGSGTASFLAGASVTLAVSYIAQLLFLAVCFVVSRAPVSPFVPTSTAATLTGDGYRRVPFKKEGSPRRSPTNKITKMRLSPPSSMRIKSVPYSQTSQPACTPTKSARTSTSMGELRTPPGSSSGPSARGPVVFGKSNFAHVRPVTSMTRLLPDSGSERSSAGPSLQSSPDSILTARDRSEARPSTEDFDSWDTSAVDPRNRQFVLEHSLSPASGRFLETIPASPSTSRSPSPGNALELARPRSRRRSRSCSPSPSASSPRKTTRLRSQSHSQLRPPSPTPSLLPPPSLPGEAHIHPLFRSNSPTPPPAVSAGTVVTAAPNAGRVIAADARSLRTLHRMRSGSLPTVPSPLSRQGSADNLAMNMRRAGTLAERPSTGGCDAQLERRRDVEQVYEEDEEDGEGNVTLSRELALKTREAKANSAERTMTPPIPEWILSAGTRSSLTGYQSRKTRLDDAAAMC